MSDIKNKNNKNIKLNCKKINDKKLKIFYTFTGNWEMSPNAFSK